MASLFLSRSGQLFQQFPSLPCTNNEIEETFVLRMEGCREYNNRGTLPLGVSSYHRREQGLYNNDGACEMICKRIQYALFDERHTPK